METQVLHIKNLSVSVKEGCQDKSIIAHLDLGIKRRKIVALVGSSGSGKTTTGLAILRLLHPAIRIKSGEILFNGENLLNYPESRMRRVRGKEISMVFQEPLTAFNPVFRIGYQIEEVLRFHAKLKREERQEKVIQLLDLVGISDPKRTAKDYPHQLSGGMRQRAMIAQAIAADPQLIIADEPTSNLDVTLQVHIIELFRKLKCKLGISMLLITHDLGIVRHLADEVAILFEGQVVECGETQKILDNPQHSFTCQLMNALAV